MRLMYMYVVHVYIIKTHTHDVLSNPTCKWISTLFDHHASADASVCVCVFHFITFYIYKMSRFSSIIFLEYQRVDIFPLTRSHDHQIPRSNPYIHTIKRQDKNK